MKMRFLNACRITALKEVAATLEIRNSGSSRGRSVEPCLSTPGSSATQLQQAGVQNEVCSISPLNQIIMID